MNLNAKLDAQYECTDSRAVFSNGVEISRRELDALFKVKAMVTCSPSFIWMELLRLKEGEDFLQIKFRKINYRRKQAALEMLSGEGHFELTEEELDERTVLVTLSAITNNFKSILPAI